MSFRLSRLAVTLALILASASSTMAQSPQGALIVLPGKLIAGQRATLAVLDAEGRLVPTAEVEFGGGGRMTTDATGRLTFPVPNEPGILRVSLAGKTANASAAVLPQAAAPGAPEAFQITDVQRMIPLGERFSIDGEGFRGVADENHVVVAGQPALVLAASPVVVICLAGPKTEPGAAQLSIEIGGRSAGPVPVTLIRLEVAGDKPRLDAGEHGHLTVRVRGTAEPVEIEVRSLSPSVVRFLGGGRERQTTSGGAENSASFEMLGIAGGDFSVEARLVPGVQGLPDVAAARQELRAALPLAPSGWGPRVEKLLDDLDKHPQDNVKVRDELEKMLAQRPEGDFGRHIEAAWKILLNR